jgi:hypothetical protein
MRYKIFECEVLMLHFLHDGFKTGESLFERGLRGVLFFSAGFAASHDS